MNKCYELLKVQVLAFFNINKMLHTKDKQMYHKGILMIFLGVFFVGISLLYNIVLGYSLYALGAMNLLLVVMMTLTCIIIFFTTVVKSSGILFIYKDYDMTMSLPVKTSTVIVSRIVMLYLMNIAFTLIIMIPACIVYSFYMHPGISFYISYIISLLFIPLVPIIAATFFGALLTLVTSRFKYASYLQIVVVIVFLVGISFAGQQMSDPNINVQEMSNGISSSLYTIYPMSKLYIQGICNGDWASTFLFLMISIVTFWFFTMLISIKYRQICTSLGTTKSKGNYKLTVLKTATPFMAVYTKEIKRFFSSSLYVLNTGIGSIFLILMSIAILFVDTKQIEILLELPGFSNALYMIAPLIVSGFTVMSCTSSCSYSLEGKNLWILLSSPLTSKTIFSSKIAVNLTILLPVIIFADILISFALSFTFFQSFMLFIVPTVYAGFISVFGLVCNLAFPNLTWTNEVIAIKQNISMILVMLVGIICVIIPGFIALRFPFLSTNAILGITVLVISFITYILYRRLCERRIFIE